MIVDRFPGIRAVALKIAYDNGLINRFQSEEEGLLSLDEILGADGVDEADLRLVDEWCQSLSEEDQAKLAAGEHSEMIDLQQEFQRPKLLGIFDDIFNGEDVCVKIGCTQSRGGLSVRQSSRVPLLP